MLIRAWLFLGMIVAGLSLGGFFYVLTKAGWHSGDPTGAGAPFHHAYLQATTMTFLGMIFGQIGTAFAVRTQRASLWSVGVFSNRYLLLGSPASWRSPPHACTPLLCSRFWEPPLRPPTTADPPPIPAHRLGRRRAAPLPDTPSPSDSGRPRRSGCPQPVSRCRADLRAAALRRPAQPGAAVPGWLVVASPVRGCDWDGTTRTGHGETCSKRWVTLPSNSPVTAPWPRHPATMTSAPTSRAIAAISCAGCGPTWLTILSSLLYPSSESCDDSCLSFSSTISSSAWTASPLAFWLAYLSTTWATISFAAPAGPAP